MQPTPAIPQPDGNTTTYPGWVNKRIGKFRVLDILGEGTNGRVFRVEDTQLGRQIALKVMALSPDPTNPLHTVEHAIAEARMSASLEHPNIVRVYEVRQTARVFYIAMELVEGGNLKDLVHAGGPIDYRRACQLTAEAAEALAYAHQRGVIHRDVKPANLMLNHDGRCKLADFGLAIRQTGIPGKADLNIAGTPQFIAPELIQNEPATASSDIYSLGATLWYLLTGSPPFVSENIGELLDKHLNEPLPNLQRIRPDVPESLSRALNQALAKDPAKRFKNAAQFEAVLRVHTIPVDTTGSSLAQMAFLMAPKPPPVRKTLLWAGLAGIFGVAGAGALVYWFSGGWSGPNYRPAIPPIIGVASPHSARHPTTVGPGTSQPVVPLEIPPETILQANDTSTLTHLASDYSDNPQTVTVEGQITSNEISKKGKYFRLSFIGADGDKDFVCTYPPTLLPALQTKFGSSDGLGLQGNTIRITGKIEMVKGHPTIRIESSNQIQLAE